MIKQTYQTPLLELYEIKPEGPMLYVSTVRTNDDNVELMDVDGDELDW